MTIISNSSHRAGETGHQGQESTTPPPGAGRTPTTEEAVAAMEYMNVRIQELERERERDRLARTSNNIPSQQDINSFFAPRPSQDTAAGYLAGPGNGSFGTQEVPIHTPPLGLVAPDSPVAATSMKNAIYTTKPITTSASPITPQPFVRSLEGSGGGGLSWIGMSVLAPPATRSR